MNRLSMSTATCVAALCLLVAGVSPAVGQTAVVGNYEMVSQRRVTLTVSDFTYRATLTNNGSAIQSATATLTSNSPNTVVIDNSLEFGAIGAGGSGTSTDTFTIRQNRTVPFNPADLVWTVTAVTPGGSGSLRVRSLSNVRAGDSFSLVVDVLDGGGLLDTTFGGIVNVNASAIGGSNFSGGQQSATAVNGVATFNVVLNNAADGYIVTASAAALPNSASNAFNVTFRSLTIAPLANVQSGTGFTVQVDARDADGQLAENFSSANNLSLANLSAAVPALGQTTFDAAVVPAFGGGSATFTGLRISNAADGYRFTATAASSGVGVLSPNSNPFNVTASTLAFSALQNQRAGDAFSLSVTARDNAGLTAENFVGTISVNAAAVGGSNFVGGAKTTASVAGTATFPSLVLNNAANGYVITASAVGGLATASSSFNVTFRSLTIAPVANVQSGTGFTVQVDARDADGQLAENFSSANSLSLANLSAAVPALGQTTFDAAVVPAFGGGSATFTGLRISNAADGYRFTATAASSGVGVLSPNSNPFNVTASTLVFPTVVPNQQAGSPFNLTVDARDNGGLTAENFASNVSVSAAAVGGANFNGGTRTVAAVSGTASFVGLVLNTAADGYTITATGAGLVSAISNAFNVTAVDDETNANAGAVSLTVSLGQLVIGAGSASDISAVVRDSNAAPVVPVPHVSYEVLADDGSLGTMPVVIGEQVITAVDTRGSFTLRGTVGGTTADVGFSVTADSPQSRNAGKYVTLAAAEGAVARKLAELADAFTASDLGAIPLLNDAIQSSRKAIVITGRDAIQRAVPVAPETGFLPSTTQLIDAGMDETPDDDALAALIPQIVAMLDDVSVLYDALGTDPAADTTDSVAQVDTFNQQLEALRLQLASLNVTPHGIVKYATRINNLVRSTLPRHLHAVSGKVASILEANSPASVQGTPTEFLVSTGARLQMELANRIYGTVMQRVTQANLIIGSKGLLQDYSNPASLDDVFTGAPASVKANGIPNSVIKGSGMNAESVASHEVLLIGGSATAAVKNLTNAFDPSAIGSFDSLDEFFDQIIEALGAAPSAFSNAEQPADSIRVGCVFYGPTNPNCGELIFDNGFESVSSCSEIVCSEFEVLVLYRNKDAGYWASRVVLFKD